MNLKRLMILKNKIKLEKVKNLQIYFKIKLNPIKINHKYNHNKLILFLKKVVFVYKPYFCN